MAMSELPPGFELDHTEAAIPSGFVLDAPSMGEDTAKSVAAGLGTATIGALGSVGDARSLLSRGVSAMGDKLGFDPSTLKSAAGMAFPALNAAPTSSDIRSTVTDPIVDPDYKPQYWTGSAAKKLAEFGPGMLMGGPEGAGARFLTNVAAPAIGSEIGEKVGGPIGGVVGALAGGAGASSAAQKFRAMAAARQAASAIPSAEDLLTSGGNGFEAVKASNAIIKPGSVEQMAKDIKTELLNDGKHPLNEGQAGIFNALDSLESMGQSAGVTTKDMEVIRKRLSDARMSINPSAAGAARDATKSFMDKYSNLGQADLLHGSNPFPTLKDAIADYAAGKRSNTIMGKVDLANLNAGTAGSGANQDNALRQAIKQLARPQNNTNVPIARKLGFNDAETAAIRQAATGTAVGNTARYLGKYAPTGIVSAAGGAGLGHLVGGPAGAAIPVVGYIAKKIGDLSTKKAVQAVDSLVRSRSPLAAHVAAQLPPQIVNQLPAKSQRLLQTMILADPALSQTAQQQSQPVGQTGAYQAR
jgi:hypothetical protein